MKLFYWVNYIIMLLAFTYADFHMIYHRLQKFNFVIKRKENFECLMANLGTWNCDKSVLKISA